MIREAGYRSIHFCIPTLGIPSATYPQWMTFRNLVRKGRLLVSLLLQHNSSPSNTEATRVQRTRTHTFLKNIEHRIILVLIG